MSQEKQHKVIVPTFTPYDDEGNLNVEAIKQLAQNAGKVGADVIYVQGTTGESMSLTLQERKLATETWKAYTPSNVDIIVHVGCESLQDAKELARHAQQTKVTGIAAVASSYYRPANIDALVSWMSQIAASAPELPFYYYHFPGMTNVNFPASQFLRAASSKIPTLRGCKFTDTNMDDFQRCINLENGKFEMWAGYGMSLGLPSLLVGSRGFFVYDFFAPVFRELVTAWENNPNDREKLMQLQKRNFELNEIVNKYGAMPSGRAILSKQSGVKLGPLRPPFESLSPEIENQLIETMKSHHIVN